MADTTTKYLTTTELDSGDVFLQYLEELRSGSIGTEDGFNRPLVHLAQNADALLETLQAVRSQTLSGGGTVAWDSGTGVLSWSSSLYFRFAHELSGSANNVLAAGSATLSAAGKVAYVKFDRTSTGGALTVTVVANIGDFAAVLAGDPTHRLDYQILAVRDGTGIIFADGRRLRSTYSYTANGFTDTQYGQQTELTLVHTNQKENFKFILSDGGHIHWDATEVSGTVGRLHWSDPFVVNYPASNGELSITGVVISSQHTKDMEDGDVLYVSLTRALSGTASVAVSRTTMGNAALAGDDVFVLAVRAGDRVYLYDGTALSDGETVLLGGVRSGVQWFYGSDGPVGGDQVTNFGSTSTYVVGSGELMVYRNGVKARCSAAYWDNGTWPGTGSLVGSIADGDQYLEENTGQGRGHRILWLADNGHTVGHPVGTHAPGDPFTYPDDADYIEAFVGVQGEGPSPVESLGIEGDTVTLEGAVKFRGEDGVALEVDGNTLVVKLDAAAGVASLTVVDQEGDPSPTGAMAGAMRLQAGRLIDISDDGDVDGGVITLALDVADGQADALAAMVGSMDGGTDPSTDNPVVTRQVVYDLTPAIVTGFEIVVVVDGVLMIGPGTVRVGNQVASVTSHKLVAITDVVSGESIAGDVYAALYVGVDGSDVGAWLSETWPEAGGKHPTENIYFLCSVVVAGGALNYPMVREGMTTRFDSGTGLTAPAVDGTTKEVDMDGWLPGDNNHIPGVFLELTLKNNTGAVASSTAVFRWGTENVSSPSRRRYLGGIADQAYTTHAFYAQINTDKKFYLKVPANWVIVSLDLVGWTEGRVTVGDDIWS